MRVVTFGEILLRLAAPGYTKLFQKDTLESTFCGGEANVAVSLAQFGINSSFVTKVPNTDVGIASINSLRYFGVDTKDVIFGDGRMGLYYLEKGASQRPSRIIYDRSNSAIAMSNPDDFNWDKIFENASWFHWTGINPAIGGNLPEICLDACKTAKNRGLTVSCDLNFRSKLWSSDEAREIMKPLMRYVDVCICNEEDADKALGIKTIDSNVDLANLNKAGYLETSMQICNLFGCSYVATTLRESYSASRNGWSAMLYDARTSKAYFSRKYDIQIVDRVGGGDSFAAGLIFSLIQRMSCSDAIEFACAASCLKHTIEGDYNRIRVSDVETLLHSNGNGRVLR